MSQETERVVDSHRAATTGSTGFVALLLNPPLPEGVKVKPRLNTADRVGEASEPKNGEEATLITSPHVGNTPLHLAMESGHAEVACKLIEAGADRDRVRRFNLLP